MVINLLFIIGIVFVLWLLIVLAKHLISEHRMKLKGYLIRFYSSGALDTEDGNFIVSYEEGNKKIVSFSGKEINKKRVLDLNIPSGKGYGPYDPQGYNRELMTERIRSFAKENKILIARDQILRKWLLEKLIYQYHLNMEERSMMGEQKIKMSEIKLILGEHFRKEELFPVVKRSPKGLLHDGYIIEKLNDKRYALHFGQYGPWCDYRGSEVVEEFETLDTAVEAFYKQERDLDGIKIEREI